MKPKVNVTKIRVEKNPEMICIKDTDGKVILALYLGTPERFECQASGQPPSEDRPVAVFLPDGTYLKIHRAKDGFSDYLKETLGV